MWPCTLGEARKSLGLLAVLAPWLFGWGPSLGRAQPPVDTGSATEIRECFQIVVTDAVLVNDLVCDTSGAEDTAITVAASNITLDLGGFAIRGYEAGVGVGVSVADVDGVTIKNGTVDGFLRGIDLVATKGSRVEGVTVRNLESVSTNQFVNGITIAASQGVVVKDSSFEFLPVAHKYGVELANGEATIDDIDVYGGGCGVEFVDWGLDEARRGSRGSVINSRFVGVTIAAVLILSTDSAQIAYNEFIRNEVAVSADEQQRGDISGFIVNGNSISDGFQGVHFLGISHCSIQDNVISGNSRGISLDMDLNCMLGGPESECYYSSGNVVADNQAVGNSLDLYHHEEAVRNLWLRNTCETKEGAEIPECSDTVYQPRARRRSGPAH